MQYTWICRNKCVSHIFALFIMSSLSERQKDELHAALLAYLEGAPSFKSSAAAFRLDLGDACASLPSVEVGALERRWASILRLQKRISELESQLADAQSANHTADKRARGANVVSPEFYPRSVALSLAGHRKAVTCVAVHPLFSVAASGSEDASIKLWDTEAGVCERSLTGHINAITDLCFDATGLLLASASTDASIKLWDFGWASGPRPTVASAGAALTVGPSSAGSGSVVSSATGSPGFTVGSPAALAGGAAAASAAAATAGAGARAATYACLKTLRGHDGPVTGVCFAPSAGGSGPLLSCSRDGSVGVWDVDSGHCLRRIRDLHGGEWIRRLAVNAGGTVFSTCSNDRVRTFLQRHAVDAESMSCSVQRQLARPRFGACALFVLLMPSPFFYAFMPCASVPVV